MSVRLGRFVERNRQTPLRVVFIDLSGRSVLEERTLGQASARRDPAVYKSRLPRDPYLLFPYTVPKRTDDCN